MIRGIGVGPHVSGEFVHQFAIGVYESQLLFWHAESIVPNFHANYNFVGDVVEFGVAVRSTLGEVNDLSAITIYTYTTTPKLRISNRYDQKTNINKPPTVQITHNRFRDGNQATCGSARKKPELAH